MIKIKICGIKTLEDALAAVRAGADMLGFNFYPKSARYVDLETCQRISLALRQETPSVRLVGVFVNVDAEEIIRALKLCSLDLAQLSGKEPPALSATLGSKGFKAFHGIPDRDVRAYACGRAPAFLIDAEVSGSYGGTGMQADWVGAGKLARRYPLLLAGGLDPENVAKAIETVNPWGVDVASGVESKPGVKDRGRMRAFVAAARSMELESG
jgi:phosphoribosylanthranilate isomerase